MDYSILQFHHYIPTASVIYVIFFSGIVTGSETGSPSDVLGASLAHCVTIISILKCSTNIPLTKVLFLVNIVDLIV